MLYNFEELKNIVKSKVSEKRYNHIMGVVSMAENLAKKNFADIEKCKLAALLHDICKEMKVEEMKKICLENFSELDNEDLKNDDILHGFVAAYWVQKNLGIDDESVLNAIKYHTIGNKKLDLVGKIIYIADAIEIGRKYPSVEKIREKTFENLNEGILFEIEEKTKFLESIAKKSHRFTEEMKKEIIKKM